MPAFDENAIKAMYKLIADFQPEPALTLLLSRGLRDSLNAHFGAADNKPINDYTFSR